MLCEMCGTEAPRLKRIVVEGSTLNVCSKCAKFGSDSTEESKTGEHIASSTISERLERRERKMRSRDVFEGGQEELALDYAHRIRKARSSMDLSQEQLGRKINEKKSVVAKLENGDMIPDEKLIKKLERELHISLKEKVSSTAPPTRSGEKRKMTLGDFIRVEKG